MTSIVIPVHNQLRYTRMCVESIRWYTDEPYELIVVDNGSRDGTPEWLQQQPDIRFHLNEDNRGFARACNQGLGSARGDAVLLLNNDVVVTPYWLTRLRNALHRSDRLGLVGPLSNRVSGEQQVPACYWELDELERFAGQLGSVAEGHIQLTSRLVGFCLLMKRAVIEKIGLLDERFELGNFEDDDYCRRSLAAGFQAAIACDTFVHHFGSVSFRAIGWKKAVDAFHQNWQRYQEKWGEQNQVVSANQSPPTHFRSSVRGEPRLSLAMICRDNAGTIGAALESIRPWVDEMIVVDTGSKDRTPAIAAGLGAQVHTFPWCDDFSAARNESLRHCRGRWIFWMDSDDTISPENGRRLRQLVDAEPAPDVFGYVMQVHCPGAGEDGLLDVTVVDHVKVFRNRDDLRFEGRIHEQILGPIRRAGGDVQWTDIFVTHSGYDHSADGQKRKRERDLRILEKELSEQPDHPFVLFNLGMTYTDVGEHRKGAFYLERSIRASEPAASHLRKAYALLIFALRKEEDTAAAERVCEEARSLYPGDPEILFRHALLLQERGDLDEAAAVYRLVLEAPQESHFSSLDIGIRGFKTRQNLAILYERQGLDAAAEEQWRAIVAEAPAHRYGWRGLWENLLRQGNETDAIETSRQLFEASDARLRTEAIFCLAAVKHRQGHYLDAKALLESARPLNDQEALERICRVSFEAGDVEAAEYWLGILCSTNPEDPAALHNLGTVYLQLRQPARALDLYRRSLALRPNSEETLRCLAHAERQCEQLSAPGEALQHELIGEDEMAVGAFSES